MTKIPPVGQPERPDLNSERQKSPEERVGDVKEIKDSVKLLGIEEISLELKEAEEALALLPTSETLNRKVILLKSRLEELKAKQE